MKSKVVGIWNGATAYSLNSKRKFLANLSYTTQVKQVIAKKQTSNSKVATGTTSKIVNFVNNVSSNKVANSAVNSLSNIYIKPNKETIAFKLLATKSLVLT